MPSIEQDTMGAQTRGWHKHTPEHLMQLRDAYKAVFEVYMHDVGPVEVSEYQEFMTAKPYWVTSFFADGFRKPEYEGEDSWFDYSPKEFD